MIDPVTRDAMAENPPTGTVETLMAAVEHAMLSRVGMPKELHKGPLPSSVDLCQMLSEEENLRFIQQNTLSDTMFDLSRTMLEQMLSTMSIRTQAQYMDMRIVNNRKRMRKRVRQRRRRWTTLDEHWTNNPQGDW